MISLDIYIDICYFIYVARRSIMSYKKQALEFLYLQKIKISNQEPSEIANNIAQELMECIYKIEKYTVNDNDIKEELVRHKFMYDFNNWEKQNNG